MAAIWGKVYGSLHTSMKWQRATDSARALWTSALSWSVSQGTDGCVPRDALRVLGSRKSAADKLVEVGLWEVDGDGWRFHDWLGHNVSDQQIQESRAATRARVQKHRAGKSNAVTPDSSNALHVTPRNAARTEQNREEQTDRPRAEVPDRPDMNPDAILQSHGLPEKDRPAFKAWLREDRNVRSLAPWLTKVQASGEVPDLIQAWHAATKPKKIHPSLDPTNARYGQDWMFNQ